MQQERAKLNLDDEDDGLDLTSFKPTEREKEANQSLVEKASMDAGFPSRSPKKKRRRRKPSPHVDQVNIRCRSGMREIFQELGEHLKTRDHTTFERAIRAVLVKEKLNDLLKEFDRIVD